MSIIETKDLTYVYNPEMLGETKALDAVSFSVEEPCIIGIIGHTGSGKSTLLQHLNGLIKPSSGDVYIGGECITDGRKNLADVRRKIGLVFQYPEYQLFDETVAGDVAFGPKNLGIAEDEVDARVKRAIDMVGLDYDEVAEMSPFELSGGMKRRAAIAGVIAMEPEILMLDELTAGLDPAAHKDIIDMIKKVQREMNMLIVFVSHNMSDIADLSDRVFVMKDGRIVMDGSPEDVFSRGDELKEMGLSVPPSKEIAGRIKERAPEFESKALSLEGLAEDIQKFRSIKEKA